MRFETVLRPNLWFAGLRSVSEVVLPNHKPVGPGLVSEKLRMLSFAIADRTSRGGTAMSLIAAFEDRICDQCAAYEGTVLTTNVPVLRFYDLVGFVQMANNGREVVVRKSLAPPASSE